MKRYLSQTDKANVNGEKCSVGFFTGWWAGHKALKEQSHSSRNTKVHFIGIELEEPLGDDFCFLLEMK